MVIAGGFLVHFVPGDRARSGGHAPVVLHTSRLFVVALAVSVRPAHLWSG